MANRVYAVFAMKILENTPDRLVAVERPWFLAAMLAGFSVAVGYGLITDWAGMGWPTRALLLFLGAALLLVLHYFVHWVRAEFNRGIGRIEISRRGPFYETRRQYSLKYLNRVRVDENNSEGVTYRIVLEFDEAMLAEMDPARRADLEKQQRRGLRQAAPHEVPLTSYYSGVTNAGETARVLNEWVGVGA